MRQRIRLVQRQEPKTRLRFRLNLRTIHIYVAGGVISVASIFILLLSNISNPAKTKASETGFNTPGSYESHSTEDITYDNFKLLSNSFSEVISARYTSQKREVISMKLVTMKGSVVLFENFPVKKGANLLQCDVPASIPKETYILFLENKDSVLATSIVACNP